MSEATPATVATPAPNPLQAIFANLGHQLLNDVEGAAKAAVMTFATNIKNTPTTQNLVAQGVQLGVTLSLSGPTLESEGIGQLADAISTLASQIP